MTICFTWVHYPSTNYETIHGILWQSGILGFHSPQALLNAVFFSNGQNFCLRGLQEHYNLLITQITFASKPNGYIYSKFGSKNGPGGISDTSEGKIVPTVSTGKHNCQVNEALKHYGKKCGKFYLPPFPLYVLGIFHGFMMTPCC